MTSACDAVGSWPLAGAAAIGAEDPASPPTHTSAASQPRSYTPTYPTPYPPRRTYLDVSLPLRPAPRQPPCDTAPSAHPPPISDLRPDIAARRSTPSVCSSSAATRPAARLRPPALISQRRPAPSLAAPRPPPPLPAARPLPRRPLFCRHRATSRPEALRTSAAKAARLAAAKAARPGTRPRTRAGATR